MAEMPIPSDWDGVDYCRWSVLWPNSPTWFGVLNGLIGMPYQGRFWDADTGSILGVKASFEEVYQCNFSLREVIMACGDNGLQELAAAIRLLAANQCCDTSPSDGGVVTVIVNNDIQTPIYGSQEPIGLTPGQVPPGYPGSLEEYNSDKCRTAAAIITGFISSLRNLAYVNFAQNAALLAVVIAAIAGVIAMPQFLVPILIAAAIGQVGLQAGLLALADGVETNFDTWVCYLYESDDTEVALGYISDGLDALIAAIPATGALGWALKTIALVLVNSDTVNKLFSLNQGEGPSYDCNCGVGLCAYAWDADVEGWAFELVAGYPPATGVWSDSLNSDGGIQNIVDTSGGSGDYNMQWVSPSMNCEGNTITLALASQYTVIGTWEITVSIDGGSDQVFPLAAAGLPFRRDYLDLGGMVTVTGVRINYIGSFPSTGYNYASGVLDLSVYTA